MNDTADILLITATEVETQGVLEVARQQTQQPWTRRPFSGNIYYDLGVVAGASVFLVQSAMGAIGLGAAAQTVQQGIEALNPIAVIMVGIAFGMQPRAQRIGDVLIARHILLYEPQKVASDSGQSSILPRGTRADVSPWLLKAFRSGIIDWSPPAQPTQRVRPPQVQAGLILSGEKLIDNLAFRDQLGRIEPEAIGGEMEGAGLYVAAHQGRVDWILVKAICDWADGTKDRRLPQRQRQAAHNVAHFVFHVIGQGTITRAAAPRQRPDKSDQTINNQAPNQAAQGNLYAPVYVGSSSPMPRDPLAEAQEVLDRLPLDTIPDLADLPPGSRMPLARNPLFVGREADLMRLAAVLKAGETAAIGQIAVATGLGGIGKTNLATEFVHRYGQYFAGGVFWLSFTNAASIPTEIAAYGTSLSLPGFADLKLDDQVARVRQVWQEAIPRLLIFDNCEDEALLDAWRPTTGGCRVLITSRRARWDAALGVTAFALDVLPRAQSIALLRRFRPDLASDNWDLDAIAAELGDLPLALHLAGSSLQNYVESDIGNPAQFLAELRNAQLLDHDALRGIDLTWSPTNHELHVARTFKLSFDRLDAASEIDSTALKLLTYAACFAPGESIPYPLLESITSNDFDSQAGKKWVVRGLNRLKALGLITAENSMHRLLALFVQKVSTDFLAAQSIVERAFLAMLQPNDEEVISSLTHLRFITNNALKRQDELASDLAFELDNQLFLAGDYKGALDYGQQALAIREKLLPPNHRKRAQSLNSCAGLHHRLGYLDDARRDYELALAILDGTSEDQRLLALVHGNLGFLLTELGELDTALSHLQQGHTIREEVFGEKHKLTAGSYSNLATWYFYRGDFIQAQKLYQRSLDIFLLIFGAQHQDTARVRQNLGEVYFALKKFVPARSLLAEALAVREALLPPEHPDIAYTLHQLALCCHKQREAALACQYMRRAFQINKTILGPDHPDTESSRAKLKKWKCPDKA